MQTFNDNQPGSPVASPATGIAKPLPKVKPMLAKRIDHPFDHPDWIYELKHEGCRALAAIHESYVQLYSRNFISFTANYPLIVEELKTMEQSVVFDGEIVVEKRKGEFGEEQVQSEARFHIFDIIHLNGYNLFEVPLIRRKEILKSLLENYNLKHIVYTEHVRKNGTELFEEAINKKLEGIVARNAFSPYRIDRRTRDWLKIKVLKSQAMVIAGITVNSKGKSFFDSLQLGIIENETLKYAGICENGFTEKSREKIYNALLPHFINKCPFNSIPKQKDTVQWVKPKLTANILFDEWTNEHTLRYAVFSDLREN